MFRSTIISRPILSLPTILAIEPSFTAAANTPSVNGLSGPLLANNPNSVQPFRLTRAQAVLCDQDHNYGDEQKAFDGGLMDMFVQAVGSH